MTPKEKAKELVNKNYSFISGMEVSFISKLVVLPSGDNNYETAKQCALIAVDEIINGNFAEGYDHNYWTQVKTQINNL